MTINTRIREIRKSLNLTQKEFGKRIGLTQNSISCLEKDGTNVTTQTIRLICAEFGIYEEWLVSGTGERFNSGKALDDKMLALISIYRELSPLFQQALICQAENLLKLQEEMNISH
ncbi:MAG: helix-turn-helix domain-containing protein [Clostridiales bacterium]|nr:helix-turn-helix domain-containing protein [Clostridiales bacterium]